MDKSVKVGPVTVPSKMKRAEASEKASLKKVQLPIKKLSKKTPKQGKNDAKTDVKTKTGAAEESKLTAEASEHENVGSRSATAGATTDPQS